MIMCMTGLLTQGEREGLCVRERDGGEEWIGNQKRRERRDRERMLERGKVREREGWKEQFPGQCFVAKSDSIPYNNIQFSLRL